MELLVLGLLMSKWIFPLFILAFLFYFLYFFKSVFLTKRGDADNEMFQDSMVMRIEYIYFKIIIILT